MPKKLPKTVLPDPLPKGEILTDITKKKWILGPSIGKGGFGEIYSAAEYDASQKAYQYVVKIEPHGNGPLFCEMHFFMRNAKPDMIKNWCSEKKVTNLGIPRYLGSGSHEHAGKKYRFLVMDKYGKDLWNIFLENKKMFPVHTVFRLGLQLLDSLEYIHSNGYCHADLKGANILLGLTKSTQNQVFLVDFGLASKYTQKEFKPDPKKAHNGTIEYTSRDAHDGVPTRRGDIEILAYNLIQWMGCALPWMNCLTDPVAVQKSKNKYMDDVTSLMNCCFGKTKAPAALDEFVKYVAQMSYDTTPDYKKLRTILAKGLKAAGGATHGAFEFKATKHKNEDVPDAEVPEKKSRIITPVRRTPRAKSPKSATPKNGRSTSGTSGNSDNDEEFHTPEVLNKVRKARAKNISSPENTNGFNAEMLRLQKKIAERKATKTKSKQTKTYGSASSDSGSRSSPIIINDDDVIEATPPEKPEKVKGARRRVHTARSATTTNGVSEDELTPKTRATRQRR